MKLTTFAITVAASFTLCLLAQQAPPLPPVKRPPPTSSYDDVRVESMRTYPAIYHDAPAAIGREVRDARCPLCKRGGPLVHLLKYEWIDDVITDGADKPRACVERFWFRCLLCAKEWRKNIIVK